MKTVIFACVHNAGRSQMAAALFNAIGPRGLMLLSAAALAALTVCRRMRRIMRASKHDCRAEPA